MSDYDAPPIRNPELYMDTPAKKEFVYTLKSEMSGQRGILVEFGGGKLPASNLLALNDGLRIVSVDNEPRSGAYGIPGIDFVFGDLNKETVNDVLRSVVDGKIDAAVVADLLSYLDDWKGFLRDVAGQLNRGGKLFIFHKVGRGARDYFKGRPPTGPQEIVKLLESLGMVETRVFNDLSGKFEVADSRNLAQDAECMYVVTKG